MMVLVPSPHGGTEPRMIHRLRVVVLIDVASHAVLRYHLSLRRECAAEDVLRAIRCALQPWAPRELQFGDAAYLPDAGLPAHRFPQLVGACWNEFSVDGALANICTRVAGVLRDVVGARLVTPSAKTRRVLSQQGRPAVYRIVLRTSGSRRFPSALNHDRGARSG
jgi:hypothetical protein